MYLLDTNIIAMLDPRRQAQAAELIGWLDRSGGSIYLSVMTIAEMDAAVLKFRREGKTARADELAALVSTILSNFEERVLGIDVETARQVARFGELTHRQPVSLPDLIVAATAARHGLTILTRNTREFGRLGVLALDPFEALPPET